MSNIHNIIIKDATTDTRAVVKSDGINDALVITQNSQPLPTNAATSAKQDDQTTLITALNALITVIRQQQLTKDDLYIVLQQIRDVIAMPPDYVEATNTKAISGTVAISGMTGTNTITTVTGLTNIGGFSADMLTENTSMMGWSQLRNLYE